MLAWWLEEFYEFEEVFELFFGDDWGTVAGFPRLELGFDERPLGSAFGPGGLAFGQPGQGVDEAEIEFGFLGEGLGEAAGIEREKKLVELRGGDRAAQPLGRLGAW